jgi:hypothetical protein
VGRLYRPMREGLAGGELGGPSGQSIRGGRGYRPGRGLGWSAKGAERLGQSTRRSKELCGCVGGLCG